jgi:3-oxoacyl-[acyl-carrier-protein] synthase-1
VIPLAVTAVGFASSLGFNSAEACAAARAGLVRVSPVDTLNTEIDPAFCKETVEDIPLFVAHLAPTIGRGHTGLGKLMALGKPALEDLLRKTDLSNEQLARTALFIVLSDGFYERPHGGMDVEGTGPQRPTRSDAMWEDIASRIGAGLCHVLDLPIATSRQHVSRAGRLGLIGALEQASRWFASGEVDRCLLGALESCVEPSALLACAAAQVLKTEANPVGFMPGEAAAFLLVEPSVASDPESIPLQIVGTSYAKDVAYLDPEVQPLGHGLCEVVSELAKASGGIPPLVLADLNGTESRAADWGHALVRLRERFGEFATDLWLPVESFGETGAATGAVALLMAFEGAARGHVPGSNGLIVLCADGGGRGAVLIETTPVHH